MSTLALDLVDTDADLLELRAEWERLWRSVPDATPFQSPAWLLPWWRCFGTGEPRVAVLYKGDRLGAVLPFYILDEPPERKLLPFGAGLNDYQDALLAPSVSADAVSMLLEVLLRRAERDGLRVCDLIDVPPGAALRRADAPAGWHGEWRAAEPCPVLVLPDSVEELRRRMHWRKRRNLRTDRNRATRQGGWRIETATAVTFPALLDSLFGLHEARWREPLDPRVRAFHAEAAPLLLAQNCLRLQALLIGGRIAALYYTLLAGADRILFYLTARDPVIAYESPGTVLMGAMLEEAIGEGRREAHFLRGDESHKYAWGAADRWNAACRLHRP
jgi:CelD/BcsL family acetyltransferase involved in cellulose biosynthesis